MPAPRKGAQGNSAKCPQERSQMGKEGKRGEREELGEGWGVERDTETDTGHLKKENKH